METAKRRHSMPFGAELLPDGRVHFRLWAPAARQVELCLTYNSSSQDTQSVPMEAGSEGWFVLTTPLATVGSQYTFRIDDGMQVPDPASRRQPQDVHGPSEVVNPGAYAWFDTEWLGRPWEDAVIYELHVGSFTPEGNFAAIQEKLDHLVELGISAMELMPVADFPGQRNWGYDGVYPFAPDSSYGRPEDLKALVDAAHGRGLMVFLDVVYNHFGPEGNYLHVYAPQFFTERHMTPWGAAINYDGEHSYWVRQFFIHNALYWLEEYHFDGLRLDAVHAIMDDSQPDILTELAERVHDYFGASRYIHLVLENDHNAAHYLVRDAKAKAYWYQAQWNDDIHHALHVLLTRETDGYYADYYHEPLRYLGRCLAEGFAYQGELSVYRHNEPRGEPSAQLPPTAFVSFLQNHDQVGNRAFGERISVLTQAGPLHAVIAVLLLAPSPPLLFMGEEWGCTQPFPFFCDFGPDLAPDVVAGRRQEFARFPQFSDPTARERIPDPMNPATFEQAVLSWEALALPEHEQWLMLHRELLALRRREIIPRLYGLPHRHKATVQLSERALSSQWTLADGAELFLLTNLDDEPLTGITPPRNHVLYATHHMPVLHLEDYQLPPWSVIWSLRPKDVI